MSTLMILAGCRAVGKSTLCSDAVRLGLPLFGLALQPLFARTQLPPSYPEWQLSFNQLQAAQTWFSDANLNDLSALTRLPEQVVLHMDLLSLLTVRHCYPNRMLPFPLSDESQQSFGVLANPLTNQFAMRLYLSNPFFQRFQSIAINTLYAPWPVTAKRYQARKGAGHFHAHLFPDCYFDLEQNGKAVYDLIYQTWINVASAILKPNYSQMSQYDNEQLTSTPADALVKPLL
jgi:hypothetical protein